MPEFTFYLKDGKMLTPEDLENCTVPYNSETMELYRLLANYEVKSNTTDKTV